MTIIMFGGKRGRLASRRTPSQPWGCFAAGGTGARHEIDGIMRKEKYVNILKQHLKTLVRKLKLGPNGPQPYFQSCGKMAHGQQSQGIGVAITKPRPQSHRKIVGRTEKACASKEAYKPDSVTPALSGGMGQNSSNLLWEACGRLPKMFAPSLTI